MSMNSDRPLQEISDEELRCILDQFGRNGEPAPDSPAALKRAEIQSILSSRAMDGVELAEPILHCRI